MQAYPRSTWMRRSNFASNIFDTCTESQTNEIRKFSNARCSRQLLLRAIFGVDAKIYSTSILCMRYTGALSIIIIILSVCNRCSRGNTSARNHCPGVFDLRMNRQNVCLFEYLRQSSFNRDKNFRMHTRGFTCGVARRCWRCACKQCNCVRGTTERK